MESCEIRGGWSFQQAAVSEPTLPAPKVATTTLGLPSSTLFVPRGEPAVRKTRPRPSLLCFIDANSPPLELKAVKPFDGFRNSRSVAEFDESETSRTTCVTVGWEKYINDLGHFRKKRFQLASCRVEAQISDKNLATDDNLTRVVCCRFSARAGADLLLRFFLLRSSDICVFRLD